MSFVAARDGVQASIDGRSAYATPDDLIKLGAYNSSLSFGDFKLKFGGLPLLQDLERVATARRTLEPNARLALEIPASATAAADAYAS